MKNATIILLFFLCFCATAFAQNLQEFSVVNFEEKPFGIAARDESYRIVDGNGDLFSIIKLVAATPEDDLRAYSFDFGLCESRVKIFDGEVWVYVQRNAMRATIKRDGFKTVKYELPVTVQPGQVFEMTLQAAPRIAKKRILLFEVSPADSKAQITYKAEGEKEYKVFGDGVIDEGGMLSMRLELGTYYYRIISKNYHLSEGRIELDDAPQKYTEKVPLRPNYGTLTLKAAAGTDIYIDGEKVGTGQWSGILSPGNYNVECQLRAHKNSIKTVRVNEGDKLTVQLDAPTPITGTLSLQSSPLGATVAIDGKECGTTPEDFAGLLIGAHKITVSKSGYKSVSVDIEIKEAETTEQSVTLEKEQTTDKYYSKGLSAYNTGNYSDAVKWYQKAANRGVAIAQYSLGVCYSSGLGVSQSYPDAVIWFRKSAEQGYAEAQYNLGACYYNGKGVSQSYSSAVEWFRKAAEQGHAEAQYNLGACYEKGQGVSQSYFDAVKWYRKAAEQGDAKAQRKLGVCYYNGQGVSQSYSDAVEWFRQAAEQGSADAQLNLGICYYNGIGISQSYSDAVAWFRKAAEMGYAQAQYNLGVCYEKGEGVSQSHSNAVEWFRKAAEHGDVDAKKALTRLGY